MTAPAHQIQSLVFDIQLSPRDKAHALQNTISRMYTYRLEGLLKQFFEEVIPPGLVVKAAQVTLDLGNLSYEQLEAELPERLLQELRKAFDISLTGGDTARLFPAQYTIATTEEGYLQLLLFFLQAGHFPWWAGATTYEQLEDYIELLAVKKPRQLRALLMQEGKKEQVRRRIAWQFSEHSIKTLIQVLEPEECFFILAYHKSVTRQQQQYNLVKSGTEDFKRAVWFFIFSFLLSERETWFNRRVFIKSTLRQMSAHFNVPYLSLIGLLYQALYAAGVDIEQARLTWFIKVVLEEELPAPARRLAAAHVIEEAGDYDLAEAAVPEWVLDKAAQAQGALYIKNILAWFLQTGTVPGFTAYTTGSMEALLQQLLQQYPQQAVQLFTWAGAEEKRKNRFLYQFSPELIAAIILLLPQGGEALAASQALAQLAEHNAAGAGRLPGMATGQLAKSRLRMLWSHYAEAEYQRFHAGSFYLQGLKMLYRVPVQAWYTLLPELSILFIRGGEAALQTVVTLLAAMDSKEYGSIHMPVRQDAWRQTVGQLPEIKKILLSVAEQELQFLPLFSVFYQSPENTVATVEEALSYFLLWNKVPDSLPVTEREKERGLLADMVLLLFQRDRTRLRALFLSPLNSYAAKRRIYTLFSQQKGGRDALVANWLNTFLQADMAVYLGDVPYINGLGYYKETWKGFSLTRAAVLLSKYYGTVVAVPPDEQVLLQQAVQLLDYYFTRNSLPAGLPVQGAEGLLLIQYLFRWVLGKNSNSLYTLLQKSGHHATARLQIHQWFATNEYVNGKSVTAFTALWLQHDVLAYLQQAVQEDITETAAWLRLVSWQQLPVAVIKYAAVHFSTATLQKWLQGYSSTWYNRVLPAIEILHRLFRHFTGLTRNWPQLQLNEFILLAFAAHIEVKDAPAFIHHFFAFTDKHIPPPVYRVYEQIARAWAIARDMEPAESATLVRLVDREIAARLLQRPPVARPVVQQPAVTTAQEGYPLQDLLPAGESYDKIHVQNAGVILMHPFLAVFFNRLQMTEKGKWVSEEAQLRAVHLLHHLADGKWEHEEPLLPLSKLLCGLKQEQPVPLQIEAAEEETAMIESLFAGVFQQWEKMKNSSVDGFRQSFLQRNGILCYKGDHWSLRVEQKGYDLLLQTLPWGISTIRLPWMGEMLYVEWEY